MFLIVQPSRMVCLHAVSRDWSVLASLPGFMLGLKHVNIQHVHCARKGPRQSLVIASGRRGTHVYVELSDERSVVVMLEYGREQLSSKGIWLQDDKGIPGWTPCDQM